MNNNPPMEKQGSGIRALDRQREGISWALFLIMIGGLWLIPNVPEGVWLIGVGVIMLGLNVVRYLNGIRMGLFSSLLGVLALALGIAELFGLNWPALPMILLLIGANILYDVVVRVPARTVASQ